MGFLQWEFVFAFHRESQLRQSHATQSMVHVGACECFHNPPNSDMDYWIFKVRTNVNACDCTLGCTGTSKRVCIEI